MSVPCHFPCFPVFCHGSASSALHSDLCCSPSMLAVHPTGGKVAGVGAVLQVGLEIRGHACVCHLCCVLFRTWGFAGIAKEALTLQPVTGLTCPVPDAEGWPSSHGG